MKKRDYEAYSHYIVRARKKNVKTKILAIIFCLFSLGVVVFFSIGFSNFLTISKIVNINTNYINSDINLYAISLFSSNNYNESSEYSESVKKQGGAGYLYNSDGKYYVLASVYKSQNEAKSVSANLTNNNIENTILLFKMPALNLKVNLTSKSADVLNEAVSLFYNNYLSIYNYSIDFDKQNIDEIKVKSNIFALLENNTKVIENFNTHFSQTTNVYLVYIKIYLTKLNGLLKNVESVDESINLSSYLKELYCKVISLYQNLYSEVS